MDLEEILEDEPALRASHFKDQSGILIQFDFLGSQEKCLVWCSVLNCLLSKGERCCGDLCGVSTKDLDFVGVGTRQLFDGRWTDDEAGRRRKRHIGIGGIFVTD